MTCKKIQKKLLSFQDNNLPNNEMIEIEKHLKNCAQCSENYSGLIELWDKLGELETIDSAPFFWTKLSQRINDTQRSRKSVYNPLRWVPAALTASVILFFALMTGMYLGKSLSQQPLISDQTVIEQENNNLLSTDELEDYTGESISDVYVSLISNDSH